MPRTACLVTNDMIISSKSHFLRHHGNEALNPTMSVCVKDMSSLFLHRWWTSEVSGLYLAALDKLPSRVPVLQTMANVLFELMKSSFTIH